MKIVEAIAVQRKMISMNASAGILNPKKIIDQAAFKASCIANSHKAAFEFSVLKPFFQTRKSAAPIRAYSVIHAGPKSQFGGVNHGFCKEAYQVGIDSKVKTEPMIPAAWQAAMQKTSFAISEAFIASIIAANFIKNPKKSRLRRKSSLEKTQMPEE